jgi:hypothetical protein
MKKTTPKKDAKKEVKETRKVEKKDTKPIDLVVLTYDFGKGKKLEERREFAVVELVSLISNVDTDFDLGMDLEDLYGKTYATESGLGKLKVNRSFVKHVSKMAVTADESLDVARRMLSEFLVLTGAEIFTCGEEMEGKVSFGISSCGNPETCQGLCRG